MITNNSWDWIDRVEVIETDRKYIRKLSLLIYKRLRDSEILTITPPLSLSLLPPIPFYLTYVLYLLVIYQDLILIFNNTVA